MKETKEQNIKENKTDLAMLQLLSDAYRISHGFRCKVFSGILRHMLCKIGDEATIYFLLDEVKEGRKKVYSAEE